MHVLRTDQEEGVATLTISIGEDDHKFEVWKDGDTAYVEYEETLTWRGKVRVSEPDEDVFKELVVSDEMTDFLDEYGCEKVQRSRR